MSEKKKVKTIFEEKIKCPHCKKRLVIKKQRKTVVPAEPAEFEERIIVEKDEQTTLDE